MFLKSEEDVFLNGPPDAVIKIFSTLLFKFLHSVIFNSLRDDQIEKCSESMGIIFVLF